jgi:hypothetical protein
VPATGDTNITEEDLMSTLLNDTRRILSSAIEAEISDRECMTADLEAYLKCANILDARIAARDHAATREEAHVA